MLLRVSWADGLTTPRPEGSSAPLAATETCLRSALAWGLFSPDQQADQCPSGDTSREDHRHRLKRAAFHVLSGVINQFLSGKFSAFCHAPCCFDTILKRICHSRRSPSDFLRCFVNLIAYLFKYRFRHIALPLLVFNFDASLPGCPIAF
jgi:hypothetical protein